MSAPLLSVRDLEVHFARPHFNPLKPRETVRAVDGVSFDVGKGTTLGIVLNRAKVGNNDGYYYQYKHEPDAKGASRRNRLRRTSSASKASVGSNA